MTKQSKFFTAALLIFVTQIAAIKAPANEDQSTLAKLKAFKCDTSNNHGDLMRKAHGLLRNSMLTLGKQIENNEPLLKETIKVALCTQKYDHDAEGVEIIEPLVRKQEHAFDKVLKQFSKSEQESLNRDFDELEALRQDGNG